MLWNPPRFDTDGRPRDAYPRIRTSRNVVERRERKERRKAFWSGYSAAFVGLVLAHITFDAWILPHL